jgi:predicted RNase H-like HicB family nuclease
LVKQTASTYNLFMSQFTFPVVIEADEDGYYVSCPALQGCYSQGDTFEEAIANIKDAIRLHLEERRAAGEELPQYALVSVSMIQVAV